MSLGKVFLYNKIYEIICDISVLQHELLVVTGEVNDIDDRDGNSEYIIDKVIVNKTADKIEELHLKAQELKSMMGRIH